MAGVPDKDTPTLSGFPAGVNNVAPDSDLPLDQNGNPTALRAAVNFDLIGPSKKPRTRPGYTLRVAGVAHSPFGWGKDRLLVAIDGALRCFGLGMADRGTVRSNVGTRRLSYAEVEGEVYWSSPTELRRIRADLSDTPGWQVAGNTPLLAPSAEGGMAAGTYRVGLTWIDADGRESACNGAAEIDLDEGQGIRVFAIPAAPEGAARVRVYVTLANEDQLYAAADLDPSATETTLTGHVGQDGPPLESALWLSQPMPPCSLLRYWNKSLLGVSGNKLVWSHPFRPGLTHHNNSKRFGKRITMLEPLGDGGDSAGVWISDHKNVYWLAGGNPKDWRLVIRYDAAAVFGTSVVVKGVDVGLETTEKVVVFLTENGVSLAGLPGGTIQPLTEGRLALSPGDEGAAVFRAYRGVRQIVTTFINGPANGLAIGDRVSATVTPHSG